jgi:DNA-binding winged helix-turn-helix (wHTH) protein
MSNGTYTPTQEKILVVLADGKPHSRQELIDCLEDTIADRKNLNVHLSNLRVRLRSIAHDVVCVLKNRKIFYRHVITLPIEGI